MFLHIPGRIVIGSISLYYGVLSRDITLFPFVDISSCWWSLSLNRRQNLCVKRRLAFVYAIDVNPKIISTNTTHKHTLQILYYYISDQFEMS